MASFDKELTATDISTMLVIPTHFMNNLPAVDGGQTVDVTVLDAFREQKTFGYYIRREGNRRPVFKKGWRSYVQEKGLRVGDRVLFECVEGLPRYKIHAQRRMSLFGEEMWGDI